MLYNRNKQRCQGRGYILRLLGVCSVVLCNCSLFAVGACVVQRVCWAIFEHTPDSSNLTIRWAPKGFCSRKSFSEPIACFVPKYWSVAGWDNYLCPLVTHGVLLSCHGLDQNPTSLHSSSSKLSMCDGAVGQWGAVFGSRIGGWSSDHRAGSRGTDSAGWGPGAELWSTTHMSLQQAQVPRVDIQHSGLTPYPSSPSSSSSWLPQLLSLAHLTWTHCQHWNLHEQGTWPGAWDGAASGQGAASVSEMVKWGQGDPGILWWWWQCGAQTGGRAALHCLYTLATGSIGKGVWGADCSSILGPSSMLSPPQCPRPHSGCSSLPTRGPILSTWPRALAQPCVAVIVGGWGRVAVCSLNVPACNTEALSWPHAATTPLSWGLNGGWPGPVQAG